MLSPVLPKRDLTYLQFWLSQKWNLKAANQDKHSLGHLLDKTLAPPPRTVTSE